MSFCPTCGAPLSQDSRICQNCGADLTIRIPELPIEKLSIESCRVAPDSMVVRVRCTGTAPLTIDHASFGDASVRINGISEGNGSLKEGKVSLQPGDDVSVLTEQPAGAVKGKEYNITLVSGTGGIYTAAFVWP